MRKYNTNYLLYNQNADKTMIDKTNEQQTALRQRTNDSTCSKQQKHLPADKSKLAFNDIRFYRAQKTAGNEVIKTSLAFISWRLSRVLQVFILLVCLFN